MGIVTTILYSAFATRNDSNPPFKLHRLAGIVISRDGIATMRFRKGKTEVYVCADAQSDLHSCCSHTAKTDSLMLCCEFVRTDHKVSKKYAQYICTEIFLREV